MNNSYNATTEKKEVKLQIKNTCNTNKGTKKDTPPTKGQKKRTK